LNNDAIFDAASKEVVIDGVTSKVPFMKTTTQGDGSTIEEVAWKPTGNASECAMIKLLNH